MALWVGTAHAADPVRITLDANLAATWPTRTLSMDQQVCISLGSGAAAALKTRLGSGVALTFASAVTGVDPVEFDEKSAFALDGLVEGKERCVSLPAGIPEEVAFTLYARDSNRRLLALTSDKVSRPSSKTTAAQLSEKEYQAELKKRIAAAAQQWVLDHADMLEVNHMESGEPWTSPIGQARVKLFFLPDGRPAWPLPADLAENDKVDVYLLLPEPEFLVRNGLDLSLRDFNLSFTACQGRNRSRVRGSLAPVKTFVGDAQSAAALPTVTPEDLAVVAAARVACGAGDATFQIKTNIGGDVAQTQTLKLASVYRFTVGLQFTFDTTLEGSLSLVPAEDGTEVITRSDDLIGLSLVPVVIYHPFGYNPNRGSILGTVFGPTLGLQMPDMTESFYFGDTLCFPRGLCVGLGAHLRKRQEVDPSLGLEPGDPWPQDSTETFLTHDVWKFGKDGSALEEGTLGFYFGVTVDATVLAAISGS